jgi:hypothetical protein
LYPHNDLISYTPYQNFKLYDPSFDNFEWVDFEEGYIGFPSCHEEHDELGARNIDHFFYI